VEKVQNPLMQKGFFIAFVAFPHEVFDTLIAALCIMAISTLYIILNIRDAFSIKYGNVFVLFFFIVANALVLYSILFLDPFDATVIRQSNHLVQFVVYTHFLVMVMSRPGFLKETLDMSSTKIILFASFSASIIAAVNRDGYVHDISPNGFMLLISLLFFTRLNLKNLVFFVLVLGMYFGAIYSSGRMTPMLMMAVLILCRVVYLPSFSIKFGSLCIIALPIIYYLTLSRTELYDLLNFDHNTYIRAEFMRAAFQQLNESMLTGVGFGPSWRPYDFDYVTSHTLLSDPEKLSIVSNHHSVFDIAYRLGVPIAICFVVALFVVPKIDNLSGAVMIALAIALSLNAWLEAQPRLYNVAVFAAILLSTSSSILARRASLKSK
jgi:hypothetical protein